MKPLNKAALPYVISSDRTASLAISNNDFRYMTEQENLAGIVAVVFKKSSFLIGLLFIVQNASDRFISHLDIFLN